MHTDRYVWILDIFSPASKISLVLSNEVYLLMITDISRILPAYYRKIDPYPGKADPTG
jgi:hypothetical protein